MLQILSALVRLTLAEPRAAARYLLKNTPQASVTVEVATVVVAMGTILSVAVSPLYGDPGFPIVAALMQNPLLFAVVDLMALMISVIAVHLIGRLFGGTGTFEQALALVVWLQVVMLVFQVALVPVLWAATPLAETLTALANFFMIWLLVNFTATLHGFGSRWKVFAGLIASSIALSFAFIVLLTMLGIGG